MFSSAQKYSVPNRIPLILALLIGCGTIAPLCAQTYNIYFGDIHSQTWYSDGNHLMFRAFDPDGQAILVFRLDAQRREYRQLSRAPVDEFAIGDGWFGLSAKETPIGVRETAISDIFALDIR